MDDLAILRKETGLSEIKAQLLLETAKGDVVSAIMLHSGEDPFPNARPEPILTDTQKKLQELRNIVDQKDEMMDAMIEQQRAKASQ